MSSETTKLETLSGLELGKLVNTKQISPVEVIKYFADRIETRNPSINAFVYTKIDDALNEATQMESRILNNEIIGPLAGVPIGLKDFLPSKRGWTATHGGVRCLQTIDIEDGAFYKAAKSLGCIALGKTNAPSFGFRGTTDNKMYGPTSTPFKIGYNSGGSSGGSAAAVGDGLITIGEGGDGGGSTRLPAAWCNCFGFKPSAGIVPSICRPDAWTATHPYCSPGPITRSVSDGIAIAEKMRGYTPKDPISVPSSILNSDKSLKKKIQDLKIGYTFDFNLFPKCESPVMYQMLKTIKSISDAGAACIEEVNFKFHHELEVIEDSWLLGISIDDAVSPEIVSAIQANPSDVPEQFLYWHERAKSATMQDYRKFHEIRTDILDAHQNVFDEYDIILAPVTGCLPVKNKDDFDTVGPYTINGSNVNSLIGFAYTYLENMTGCPAASVPIGLSDDNLPIGLQVIANRYCDDTVLRFCKFLESIQPWDYSVSFNRM